MKCDTVPFAPCKQRPADYIERGVSVIDREQALPLQKVLISPKGATTTDLCEVAESEGHAITVAGVVIVGVAVAVDIAEVGSVVTIR